MKNEKELYEWLENSADLYAPGGMKRERYYECLDPDELDERDYERDDYDADADWRSEDAHLDSLYEDRYDY
jgi:hypothetical protein